MNSQTPIELSRPLLICFSHLRWNFVFQRPQHLLTRAAQSYRVLFFEEPVFEHVPEPHLRLWPDGSGVLVATPVLPHGAHPVPFLLRTLLNDWLRHNPHGMLVTWYYTPMALEFSEHLATDACVYDCMDELSGFLNPPHGLREWEDKLFALADVVFTGGQSLFQAKQHRHPNIHPFPSSVDVPHFAQARVAQAEPEDQRHIPQPRIGFFGVIDERMDLDLVADVAAALPDIQFVMIGPVVKIDDARLPRPANLHWIGGRSYAELPGYLAHWSAGWMPFALNEATRFISPTKTPEFLAAGLPLTSTAVPDVVAGYAKTGLVQIADASSMATALERSLDPISDARLARIDKMLAGMSWDRTWVRMATLIDDCFARRPLYAAQ